MNPVFEFFLFSVIIVFGVGVEVGISWLFPRAKIKIKKFNIIRYLFLLLFPILGIILMVYRSGMVMAIVFAAFSISGMVIEGLIGFAYHQILGHRLWTYHRLDLSGYTSLLSVPLWGMAGVLFWLLARIFV